MSRGELFKIGTQVHALAQDRRCFIAWITLWRDAESTAAVQGFRDPDDQALGLKGDHLGHHVPKKNEPEGSQDPESPAVDSFHLPGECPWGR